MDNGRLAKLLANFFDAFVCGDNIDHSVGNTRSFRKLSRSRVGTFDISGREAIPLRMREPRMVSPLAA
jgi:hypothetical protein